MVVVSGPGGVGKGTVVAALCAKHPELWLSRSWTTRPRRPGEDEDAYVFVSEEEFRARMQAGGFLEYAEFLGNYYGTPTPEPPPGRDLILEIDVQGARQVAATDASALLIFLDAPSAAEQEARLRHRGDPPEKVEQRLAKAAEEANAGTELGAHRITNVEVESCADEIYSVLRQARQERRREPSPEAG